MTMKLTERLAQHALERHPERSALVLERLETEETVGLLQRGDIDAAASVLQRLTPHRAAAVLDRLERKRAAGLVEALPVEVATRLLRRIDAERREELLAAIDARRERSIRRGLRFREGSAGALMDPDVLALPAELTAREALQRIRKSPEYARYNVYVVDPDQKLVGALNLRELLLARPRVRLRDLMQADPHRVRATDDRATVMAHPGWKVVHSLPVVDESGVFLGAVRYRVLRGIEEELLTRDRQDFDAASAFGQVIAAGARGIVDAVSGTATAEPGRSRDGSK